MREKLENEAQPKESQLGSQAKEKQENRLSDSRLTASNRAKERSLVLIKPDGVVRGLTGEIFARFERAGLKIVGVKMVVADSKILSKHYPDSMAVAIGEKAKASFTASGKPFPWSVQDYGNNILKQLRSSLTKSPLIAVVFEGVNCVLAVRKLCGATEPLAAVPGTVRGDYTTESIEYANMLNRPVWNLIHASGNLEEARTEIALWFTEKELYDYARTQDAFLQAPGE